MEELQGVPGSPETGKKGMSKGCLIALIVGGALLVLVVALYFVCMSKTDQIMKYGVSMLANSSKQLLVENQTAGVDTAQFNSVVDQFIEKLQTDSIDVQKLGGLFNELNLILEDKTIDSTEAIKYMDILTDYYPDIKIPEIPQEAVDSTILIE